MEKERREMAEQIGGLIKEARLAAGMTQKALAEAIDGLSASDISKAERGLKELTNEQLEAIAEVTGSESLMSAIKEEAPAPEIEEPETPTAEEEGVQETSETEGQESQDLVASVADMVGGMLEDERVASVAGKVGGMLEDERVASVVGKVGGMLGDMLSDDSE